jgi:hypothetical protein
MTAAERTALLKLIARNARVAAADIDSLAAERYAEFEQQAQKIWAAQELGVKQLIDEANAQLSPVVAQAQQLVTQRCDALGILEQFRPRVSGSAYVYRPALSRDEQGNLRRQAKAEIEASRKRAKVEIERARASIEGRVLTTAITSDEGRAILVELPSAEALLPSVDVQAILGTVNVAPRGS